MKGYKAFNKGWICRDFHYEIGKTYKLPEGQKLEMCRCGFHFCRNPIDVFGYYPMVDDTLIAEIEAVGEIQQEGTKFVTDEIIIIREFTKEQLQELLRNGTYNSGNFNSGHYNAGGYNTGSFNTGNGNSGNDNSGSFNSGNGNVGFYNSGHYNTGHHNSGNFNSGKYNSGHGNSGYFNNGNFNSGYFNSGAYNSGIFNTDEPMMRAFNKECNMTRTDFLDSLDYSFFALCEHIHNKSITAWDIERIKALPNFDAEIFEEITGIEIKE